MRTDGRAGMTMLIIVALRNCAKTPQEKPSLIHVIVQLLSTAVLVRYSIKNVQNTPCPIKPFFTHLTTNHCQAHSMPAL
jgi:hypothetical protein